MFSQVCGTQNPYFSFNLFRVSAAIFFSPARLFLGTLNTPQSTVHPWVHRGKICICVHTAYIGWFCALTRVCVCVWEEMAEKQRVLYNHCRDMWSLIIVSNSGTWLHRKGGNCYYPSIAEMGAWKSEQTAEGHPASPQTRTGAEHGFPDSLSHRTASTSYQSLKTLSPAVSSL